MSTSENDADIDKTLERGKRNIEAASRLMERAAEARRETEEWKAEKGITDEIREKFFARLSDEDKRKIAEETERLDRELQHDLDAKLHEAAPPPGGKRRPRNFV